MCKMILLEGGDTFTIQGIMEKLKTKIELQGKSVICTMFPMYDNKSGILVNQHINSLPEPDLNNEVLYTSLNVGDKVFIKNKYDNKMDFVTFTGNGYDTLYFSKIDDTRLKMSLCDVDKFEFYPNRNINIFDQKASHITRALTFSMDRNIWFTNNIINGQEPDYILVNRSYLSNFLYRTTRMNPGELEEYIYHIIYTEIKSVGLYNYDIIPLFISCENLNTIYDKINNYAIDKFISKHEVLREMQYISTIHNNFDNYCSLLERINYTHAYKKYSRYLEIKRIMYDSDSYMKDLGLEDKIEL